MSKIKYFILLSFILLLSCREASPSTEVANHPKSIVCQSTFKGALLNTRFSSFDEFKTNIQIDYFNQDAPWYSLKKPCVKVSHVSHGKLVTSELYAGRTDDDLRNFQHLNILGKVKFVFTMPSILYYGNDFRRVWYLGRRRSNVFGAGDVAFYDIALAMVENINPSDVEEMTEKDLSEKGLINTFNHINGQALITSLFSESFADYVADLHERNNLNEMIKGEFTQLQIEDLENGPVDNYGDLINNEWGQELGKALKNKYNISKSTKWTTSLVADYLNSVQAYYAWAFQINFEPIKETDELIVKLAPKLNRIMFENNTEE